MKLPHFYGAGAMHCGMCGEWVKKEDIPKVTRLSKNGKLLHMCGYPLRRRNRVGNLDSRRRAKLRYKSPISFTGPGSMKKDIVVNKEKWEKLLKTKA